MVLTFFMDPRSGKKTKDFQPRKCSSCRGTGTRQLPNPKGAVRVPIKEMFFMDLVPYWHSKWSPCQYRN